MRLDIYVNYRGRCEEAFWDTEADAERVYGLLTDGGEIFMKMEKTHFANRFAMLRDRFGASWMLLHQPK